MLIDKTLSPVLHNKLVSTLKLFFSVNENIRLPQGSEHCLLKRDFMMFAVERHWKTMSLKNLH